MPRPKRARPAPAQATRRASPPAEAHASSDDEQHNVANKRRSGRKTRSSGAGSSVAEEKLLQATKRTRDEVLDRLENEDATATIASGNAALDDDSGSSVELGRRDAATPARRRDTTGLDLADEDVFGDLDDSFGDGAIPRAPMSAETTMSMSNFKPRSRQSSFIGRNDPPIRPSSRRGSTPGVGSSFNIGMFRRRAREPSILGTSRKPRPEPESAVLSSDSESGEDFAPDAESTPLNKRKGKERSTSQAKHASPREIAAVSSSRKRKSGELGAVDSERPEKTSRVEQEAIESDTASDSDLSSLSESPQLPPVNALPPRPVTPIDLEAMAAPPASSDSEEGADVWPDIHTLAKRRRRPSVTTPVRGGAHSDVSSPPSLTHSPNYTETRAVKARGRAPTRRQASPKVTTADLTGLLPKRRHRRARGSPGADSDDELDASALAQDEDELSYLDTRAAQRRRGSRTRAASSRPGSRGGRGANSALKPKQTPASARPKSRARTYSRRSSDKENESEEEDEEGTTAFQPMADDSFERGAQDEKHQAEVANQMKEVVKKFNEVDQWELEFEEVVETSSPQDGR
ncbi:hypothetical protein HJFPF1_02964 [Paramyrothecium foliicola]|nr:hypothetical protein HJFPF1_02964 [Paramyrothecium foliicola]